MLDHHLLEGLDLRCLGFCCTTVLTWYCQVCLGILKIAKVITLQYLTRNDRLVWYNVLLHPDNLILRLNFGSPMEPFS